MFPVEHLQVSRKTIIDGPNVHMKIGIPRGKNTTMVPGVKTDHFDRFVGDGKANFGFFVAFCIVNSPALITEDMERRLSGKTIQ